MENNISKTHFISYISIILKVWMRELLLKEQSTFTDFLFPIDDIAFALITPNE